MLLASNCNFLSSSSQITSECPRSPVLHIRLCNHDPTLSSLYDLGKSSLFNTPIRAIDTVLYTLAYKLSFCYFSNPRLPISTRQVQWLGRDATIRMAHKVPPGSTRAIQMLQLALVAQMGRHVSPTGYVSKPSVITRPTEGFVRILPGSHQNVASFVQVRVMKTLPDRTVT